MITVWGRVNSLNVQKVLWALVETRQEFRRVAAGMQFGVNDTPDYRAMNPNGLVPTIDDDGFILWESNVIVRYLAAKYGAETLYPRALEERFLAERWMDWQQSALNPSVGSVFAQLIRTSAEKRDALVIENGRQATERWMAILDDHFADSGFIAGPRFTMGDIPVGASVYRWSRLPIARLPRPNLERWLAQLKERPGFQAHVALPLS